ncbi:MAG: folate family ECF transporter S component [Clostridiales bacterium]|nr:folate family ECF transporter S component [Clostridiales bacterium]
MKKQKISIQMITMLAILTALTIIIERLLSIRLPFIAISFQFIPIVICAILFGPIYTAIMCLASDMIGFFLFPMGSFFPGFSLLAIITGLTYGFFLYKDKYLKTKNLLLASFIVNFVVNAALGTFWLYIIMGRSILAYIPMRIVKAIVMFFLELAVIKFIISKGYIKNSLQQI